MHDADSVETVFKVVSTELKASDIVWMTLHNGRFHDQRLPHCRAKLGWTAQAVPDYGTLRWGWLLQFIQNGSSTLRYILTYSNPDIVLVSGMYRKGS